MAKLDDDEKRSAFGLFDETMIPKLKRMLKRFGLRMTVRSNSREWGDQVEVTIEWRKGE